MWEVRPNTFDVHVAATRRNPLIETSGETYYHNNQQTYYHNNQPPPDADLGELAIVYRQYGRGRVVYCAGLPESNYARLGHEPYRQLLANMITWAAVSVPPIRVDGLLNTEIVTNRLGSDLIIHLITGFPQRAVRFGLHRTSDTIEERVIIPNVQLAIPSSVSAVYRIPEGESLPISRTPTATSITIPYLEDWETLRLVGEFN